MRIQKRPDATPRDISRRLSARAALRNGLRSRDKAMKMLSALNENRARAKRWPERVAHKRMLKLIRVLLETGGIDDGLVNPVRVVRSLLLLSDLAPDELGGELVWRVIASCVMMALQHLCGQRTSRTA